MNKLLELLGAELYAQVTAKLGENKADIVSDGNWIPKEKFDSINEDVKEYKKQIKDRDNQLKELGDKAKGNEELQKELEALKVKNEETISNYEKTIKEKEFTFALNNSLKDAKVRNIKALKALIDTENIKIDDKGNLVGLDEQLKSLKDSDPYLFDTTSIKGRQPNSSGAGGLGGKNPFSKEHFNLTEQGKIMKENPELAKQYISEASSK